MRKTPLFFFLPLAVLVLAMSTHAAEFLRGPIKRRPLLYANPLLLYKSPLSSPSPYRYLHNTPINNAPHHIRSNILSYCLKVTIPGVLGVVYFYKDIKQYFAHKAQIQQMAREKELTYCKEQARQLDLAQKLLLYNSFDAKRVAELRNLSLETVIELQEELKSKKKGIAFTSKRALSPREQLIAKIRAGEPLDSLKVDYTPPKDVK